VLIYREVIRRIQTGAPVPGRELQASAPKQFTELGEIFEDEQHVRIGW
jgi:hypothetical protein